MLEPEILRRACQEVSPRQIKTLLKALYEEKKYIDADDPSKFIGANANFRQVLLGMCKNTLLASCAQLYDDQFQCFRIWGLQDPENRKLTARSHEKICSAIKNNKPLIAEKSLQQLISKVEEMLEDYNNDVVQ